MNSYIIDSIVASGIILPTLFLDVIAAIIGILLTKNIILPAWRSYSLAKKLDRICGTDSKHWFYGHIKKYAPNEEGLKNVIRRSKKFPRVFNGWLGPVLPEIACSHHESSRPVLSSGAPKNEITYKFIRPWIGDGLLTSSGKKWQRNRKLLTPAFHHNILKPYAQAPFHLETLEAVYIKALIQILCKQKEFLYS